MTNDKSFPIVLTRFSLSCDFDPTGESAVRTHVYATFQMLEEEEHKASLDVAVGVMGGDIAEIVDNAILEVWQRASYMLEGMATYARGQHKQGAPLSFGSPTSD